MGKLAASDALKDAGISYDTVEAVVASYCYGDPTCGKVSCLVFDLVMSVINVFLPITLSMYLHHSIVILYYYDVSGPQSCQRNSKYLFQKFTVC